VNPALEIEYDWTFQGGLEMRTKSIISAAGAAALCLLAIAALPAGAEEEHFQPTPPMPEKFDWMQMTSGEWLKGELISMYDDSLEFDSDEFDLQTVDWGDVKEVRTAGTMQIAFEDGTIAVGKLLIDRETVRVMGETDQRYPRAGLLSITAGAPKEINYWSIKASIGANVREGNTEQVETNGKIHLIRRTPKNRINIDFLSTFNRTDGATAADNQRANAGWNHYFSKRFYWTPVYGEWYRDPFVNIANRWTIGMGAGYEIIDTSKITWDVNGGLAYQTTSFDSVGEGEDDSANTPALVIGTVYDHELTKWMDFLFGYSFMIVNEESGTYTHHLETGLELELTSLLDFDITFIWDRIENPRPNEDDVVPEQDDYRLVFFLGFDF
jgi:hypothetical protein